MNASCYIIMLYYIIHWLLIIIYLQFWHSRPRRIYKQPTEVFLNFLEILQENTCVGVSYLQSCKPSELQIYLKKTPILVFSCEIWEILKNTYFQEHLNDCFCVLITSSYIDFYNPLQYTFLIFINNFFCITQLKQ